MLKKQKIAITSVSQEYESTKERQDYQTEKRIIYRERGTLMNIRKAKDNFDKNGKLKYFNCNTYEYMAKNC